MKIPIVVFSILLSMPGLVLGHDPGLSLAEVRLGPHAMTTSQIFVQDDLAPLLEHAPLLPWTPNSFPETDLRRLAAAGIGLRIGGKFEAPATVEVGSTAGDAVFLRTRFPYPPGPAIRIEVPLLGQLARGHRQHLTVRTQSGEILGRYTLKADNDAIVLGDVKP